MSIAQYARFLVVGAFVALITVAAREVIGHLLRVDTPFYYSVSVASAYIIGIVLSFLLNKQFTFNKTAEAGVSKFLLFVLIAFAGMICTWLISLALRYGLKLELIFGKYSAAIAFATAALLSSGITYPLNAMLIFKSSNADPKGSRISV